MPGESEDRTERVATNVTPEMKRTLRVRAAQRDLTMAEYLREVIEQKLGDEGNATTATVAN